MSKNENEFEGFTFAVIKDSDVDAICDEIQSRSGISRVFDFETGKCSKDSSISEFANRTLTADIETVIFVTGVGVKHLVSQEVDKKLVQQRSEVLHRYL